jgi:hypothetical protein
VVLSDVSDKAIGRCGVLDVSIYKLSVTQVFGPEGVRFIKAVFDASLEEPAYFEIIKAALQQSVPTRSGAKRSVVLEQLKFNANRVDILDLLNLVRIFDRIYKGTELEEGSAWTKLSPEDLERARDIWRLSQWHWLHRAAETPEDPWAFKSLFSL